MLLGGRQRFFPPLKNHASRDPQDQIWGQSTGQKVIAPEHAYSENF